MKLINRGFLTVRPKQAFWDWANQYDKNDLMLSENDDTEGSVYLIEDDFFDTEPILEKQFKKILKNELGSVNLDEETWPKKLNFELFQEWFDADFGTGVFDLEKTDLVSEKI